MKARIVIKEYNAKSLRLAQIALKKEYPRAHIITYKYDKDFRYEPRDYSNRKIKLAFIDDITLIREAF